MTVTTGITHWHVPGAARHESVTGVGAPRRIISVGRTGYAAVQGTESRVP